MKQATPRYEDLTTGMRVRAIEPDGTVSEGTIIEFPYGHLKPALVIHWADGRSVCYTDECLSRRGWTVLPA